MTILSPGKLWGMRRKAAPAGVSVLNHTHAAPRGARR
jgi:hypothetical protein